MACMMLRRLLVLLAFVPAVSLADPPRSTALRSAKRMNPSAAQAAQDTPSAPVPIAPNAHLRVEVYLEKAEVVPITVLENGVGVAVTRRIVSAGRFGSSVDLVPSRALKPGATVVVMVGGVRSKTYRVSGAADTTAPSFVTATLESFRSNVTAPARPGSSPGPALDEVQVRVRVTDSSSVRIRGVINGADGGRIESTMSSFVSNTNPTTTLLMFPAGSLPTTGSIALRLEAVDAAGNVGTSNKLVKPAATEAPAVELPAAPASDDTAAVPVIDDVPPPPAAVAEPAPARRGC